MNRGWVGISAALMLSWGAASADQGRQGRRFSDMDRNGDGVVTRQEWTGTPRSFEIHDWNRDGMLSGDELVADGRRPRGTSGGAEARAFAGFDTNGDGFLTRREWYVDADTFARADRNRDRRIDMQEFLGSGDDEVDERFADLDHNGDGRISFDEWHADRGSFGRLDVNRDRVLTLAEFLGIGNAATITDRDFDHNGDGVISRDEWHGDPGTFERADRNRDGRLTRGEIFGEPDQAQPPRPKTEQQPGRDHSPAYRAGYDRGLHEGRAAGREDRERNQGFDLDGQRELEQADSGYSPNVGPRPEYQDGYRAGFRLGYREGWGPK